MKTKTYHDGAQEERKAILRKLRKRLVQLAHPYAVTRVELQAIIDWLLQRNERYEKRKGGLGRKRKVKA